MMRVQTLSNGVTDVSLPNIIDQLFPSSEDSDGDSNNDRPAPYPPVHRELDGELLVYSDEDIDEMAVEGYNQLSQRSDLSDEQAQEIADLFRSLHRLDVSEVEQ